MIDSYQFLAHATCVTRFSTNVLMCIFGTKTHIGKWNIFLDNLSPSYQGRAYNYQLIPELMSSLTISATLNLLYQQ